MKFIDKKIFSMLRSMVLLGMAVNFTDSYAELNAQTIAWNCKLCHQQDSQQATELPRLQNLSAEKIYQKLIAYKNDQLSGTIMPRIAKGYTDQELQATARFLGAP